MVGDGSLKGPLESVNLPFGLPSLYAPWMLLVVQLSLVAPFCHADYSLEPANHGLSSLKS